MDQVIFERFREIIYKESGIVLPQEKLPLLRSRIQKRLNALGLQSERKYLEVIELDVGGDELINLIDVVSTNVTHFYREEAHFNRFREILSEHKRNGKKEVSIWCAAASSGEEPYTLAFEALETLKGSKTTFKILGTDICTKVLKKCITGRYSQEGISKIPARIREEYMTQVVEDDQFWEINLEVRKHLLFKKLNLVQFPYPLKGPLDFIFCRNVMIYFDRPTRSKIIHEFERLLSPGGYLVLSHSENLLGIEHNLDKEPGSIFRKRI